ncbi:MAG: type II toxin-antitoxin system Phd/YefM family antitoxin [Tissierellales bacterium]|jgi:prevent-host-death family protein|nr:type II toxin-antitoxin system Phd/YefM family antitoxin [Tissierellales bacterium]
MIKIRPIKDLRNTNEISELCHESEEPIYITKNGYGDLVVMSIETYEKKLAQAELYKKLAEAECDLQNEEKIIDAEQIFSRMKSNYAE